MLGLPKYIVDAVHQMYLDGTSKREIERIVRAMVATENERRAMRGIMSTIELPEGV
jgi:hypothetical protein